VGGRGLGGGQASHIIKRLSRVNIVGGGLTCWLGLVSFSLAEVGLSK